jgi:flagellar FliL protein
VNSGGVFLTYQATLGHKVQVTSEADLNKELKDFRASIQGEPVLLGLPQFNTNLEGVPRRMIRMEMNLEMLDAEGFEEVMVYDAEARDAVVRVLNTKTFTELETVQGKLKLKSEIVASINSFLDQGVVKNVYFTDFVVQ